MRQLFNILLYLGIVYAVEVNKKEKIYMAKLLLENEALIQRMFIEYPFSFKNFMLLF